MDGLLFDLDDTFLDHTQLSEDAYRALFRMRESGLRLIALTGRPASWAELVTRMWPVDAAIAENGALCYRLEERVPVFMDSISAFERARRKERLRRLVQSVQKELPQLRPANDVAGRVSDFTFDIGETCRMDEETIVRAISLAEAQGARTTRSSVHLHLTYDQMDKGSGAIALLSALGFDATQARHRFAFIGDSQNDASAFATFSTTVGVRNLRGDFSVPPRYQTKLPKSAGFCELSNHLCQHRN